jgi:hypothetical protein
MTNSVTIGEFLGVKDFSNDFVFKGRTEAQAVLILYSAIEVSIKQMVGMVLKDMNMVESRAFTLVIGQIYESINKDSSGSKSQYIKLINKLMKSEPGFKPLNGEKFAELKTMRNRIAHGACVNLDKSLKEIDSTTKIDLAKMFTEITELAKSCLDFLDTHFEDVEGNLIALEEQNKRLWEEEMMEDAHAAYAESQYDAWRGK